MHFHRKINRRRFLGGATAAAALAPFVPLLDSQAGETGYPTRLIIVYTAAGTIMPRWRPTGTEQNWQLSELLSPLADHKQDLIVLDGVDDEAAHHLGPQMQGGHHSICSLWSGMPALAEGADVLWSAGPTLDQFIAARLAGATAFPSLEFAVAHRQDVYWKNRLSYTGPAQPVPASDDPYQMLERVFGDPNADPSQLQRQRDARLSVIDPVAQSLRELQQRTSRGDRVKIDQHLTALREVEQQIEQGIVSCDAPSLAPLPTPSVPFENYPQVTEMMMDLMVKSLACDATRVATFMWDWENAGTKFPWLDLNVADDRFHGQSHLEDSPAFATIMKWYAARFADLLQRLKDVPEGDGTLLDNTIVVWASPCSVSWRHISRNLPIVLAGGGGGYFQTDRYHRYGSYDFASRSHAPHGGRTMNDLHLSLLAAMGMGDVETFGSPEFCTEPLL